MNRMSRLKSLRTRVLLSSAVLPLFAAPLLSHADAPASDAAMDACVKAFVSSKFEKERPYSVVTKETSTYDRDASTYRISLTATGKHSGKKFAKATCVVDRGSVVLSMNGRSYDVPVQATVLSAR